MKKQFEDKVAIITGSSKGIGAAIANSLAVDGASVVVDYTKSENETMRVVDHVRSGGGNAIAVQADGAKESDCQRLVDECIGYFGKIDILVNNAGIYRPAPLGQITSEHFHQQFNLNVLGLILMTPSAVKQMPDHSVINNVSSIVSTLSPPNTAVYNATKSAVDNLTRTFAKELAVRNIRVNSVNPGLIATEGTKEAGFVVDGVHDVPNLGRIGTPDHIATAVSFLASEDSVWMSGQTMVLAGTPANGF